MSDHAETHPALWTEEDLLAKCRWTFSRASGPGGQNRNKVETSAQIEFLPTGELGQASECRSQNENRKVALQRLRCKLAIDLRSVPPGDRKQPSEECLTLWGKYCRHGRVNISEDNWDWPAVLSVVLDLLAMAEWDLQVASESLQVSSSQLIKLLKKNRLAFAKLNQERMARGKHSLT